AIAEVLLASGIDGVICTNTTIDRDLVAGDPNAHETGGLSGRPLFGKSTAVLRGMATRLGGKLPIIGVGGILDGDTAAEKIEAGASLVR
ncbi:dihydroorotate dehydrogenase, partial [Xanthomonas hyacinthi DSM 19077]